MKEIELSIVVPIYNEEGNIQTLYERLDNALSDFRGRREFILINDGSKDKSFDLIKELADNFEDVKYINFSRNFGHQIAVTAGLDNSIGKKVVIIDADLQDPPELIPKMYEKSKEGYEVVYAKRKKRKSESFFKKITAKLFYRILSKITTIDIPLDTGDFRLMDKKVVQVLRDMPEQHKFLRGQISWVGYNQTYLEYEREERFAGETGYTWKKMFRFAMDGITAFSSFPLKFATFVGFLGVFISIIMIVYTLYVRIFTENYDAGWASLMISLLFIGSVQLLSVGIIGEYIGRMAVNLRKRPLYIVSESNINKH